MASSDDESSVRPTEVNKFCLQFSMRSNAYRNDVLQDVNVTYEGDDTYSVVAIYNGEPFEVDFLSRAATAEFLQKMLRHEHDIAIVSKNGGFKMQLPYSEDRSYASFMDHLVVLRDSRSLISA